MRTVTAGKTGKQSCIRRFGPIFLILSMLSCSTSGPIETVQSDSTQPVVPTPAAFVSPLLAIEQARDSVARSENRLPDRLDLRGRQWQQYVNLRQADESLESEQEAVENEIEQTGELILDAGKSYSFDLESYCVHAGKARPAHGDGLRLAPLRGSAASWITEILKTQGVKGVSQGHVQYLIWALLSDVRFDELSADDQATLLRFYPDAVTRFGSRRLENLASSALQSLFPELPDSISSLADLRGRILGLRDNAQALEALLAPDSGRTQPLEVGWLKMNEGYFAHVTADGFSQVHFDLYVPPSSGRDPSSMQKRVFQPWKWIGLPDRGQRLAVSTKVIRKQKRPKGNDCEWVKAWTPIRCHELSSSDRQKILALADPKKFAHTRYQSPPLAGAKIEAETDCSNFVNEIYRRAGFEYPYADTSLVSCLKVFREVSAAQFGPGDLILYSGHVGIIDGSGNVVSATWGGKERRSMLPKNDPRFLPAIKTLPKDQAHPGSWKILRWSCP